MEGLTTDNGSPLLVVDNDDPEMMYLHTSKTYTKWKSRNPALGYSSSLRAIVSGVDGNSIALGNCEPVCGSLNVPTPYAFPVINYGSNGIQRVDYSYTIGGKAGSGHAEMSVDAAFGKIGYADMEIPALEQTGNYTMKLKVDKVNGVDIPNPLEADVAVTIYEKIFPRNVLIEEFTTEQCPNCPPMATIFKGYLDSNPLVAAKTSIICHHDGYYTDGFSNAADRAFCWFYNDGGSTYAPAFMFDRFSFGTTDSGQPTPVVFPSAGAADFDRYIKYRLAEPAYVGMGIQAVFNADSTKVDVTVDSECDEAFVEPARLVVVVTEDEIYSTSQSGASGGWYHEHVMRTWNSIWGDELAWTDNKSQNTYSFDLNPDWNKANLKVVGYLSKYNNANPNDCEVFNSLTVTPVTTSVVIAGDVNGDGMVNVTDVTVLINTILGEADYSTEVCDINADGTVNVTDVTVLINVILGA